MNTNRNGRRSGAACFSIASLVMLLFIVSGGVRADVPSRRTMPLLRSPDWGLVADVPEPPLLRARAAVLVEAETGTVLVAKNPHLVVPAASLTKVVAIHAAVVADREGDIDLSDSFRPAEETWAANQAPRSSLMFLRRNQKLSVWQLLEGLAISSGNDAALALALVIDGSVSQFADRMNAVVHGAGLVATEFVEPSGLSPSNQITAYEYAAFVRAHLREFPYLLAELYSRPSYTFPQPHNMLAPDAGPPITQNNRNLLLSRYDGADGIKTGFIDESGYHIAVTAERNGRRLIAVVLSVDAPSHAEGGRLRAADAEALLDYGFGEFELLRFSLPGGEPVRVFKGQTRYVDSLGPPALAISVPIGARGRLSGHAEQITHVVAPVPDGARVGSVQVMLDGVTLGEAALTIPEVPAGGFIRRLWDSLLMFFSTLFGEDRPVEGPSLQLVADQEMPVSALMY